MPVEIVVLIGYRGSGKTAVGRVLAERLSWEFVDTDALVEQRAERTIREIFESEGELTFRRIEADVLGKVLLGRRRIISAGGGAVLSRRNRKAIRGSGACIWLTAPPDELHRRTSQDDSSETQRPDLTAKGGLDEIETVLQARLPIYEATADHVISTVGLSVEQVADAVLGRLTGASRGTEVS
jgi:shikimate kinase